MPENQSPGARRQRRWSDIVGLGFLILMVPVLLLTVVPMVVVVGGVYLIVAVSLHIVVLVLWLPRGRNVLFVYSNTIWKGHLEAEVLPRLPRNAVVLNWSERSTWPRFSLPVWLFNTLAGSREYNPIAIVFRPFALPRKFRFWQAFRDYKHGKPHRLQQIEGEFFRYIE